MCQNELQMHSLCLLDDSFMRNEYRPLQEHHDLVWTEREKKIKKRQRHSAVLCRVDLDGELA